MSFDLGDYNDVASRLVEFRTKHPEGSLQPANPGEPFTIVAVGTDTFIALQGSPADLRRLAGVLAEAADKGDALARTVRSILPVVTA